MTRFRAGLAFLAAACLAAPAPAQPATAAAAKVDPQSLSIAKDIVDLAYPPERRQALLMRTMDVMMVQIRAASAQAGGGRADPGADAILDRFVVKVRAVVEPVVAKESPALFAAFARAYARNFTRDELLQIRAFVATPAGAKYTLRSADLLSDPEVAEANTAYMNHTLIAIQPLQAEARQALAEHYKAQQR
jgi:hypothetical protein